MTTILRLWWWLCDRPLMIRLWLYDRIAGPLPDTAANRRRRLSTPTTGDRRRPTGRE